MERPEGRGLGGDLFGESARQEVGPTVRDLLQIREAEPECHDRAGQGDGQDPEGPSLSGVLRTVYRDPRRPPRLGRTMRGMPGTPLARRRSLRRVPGTFRQRWWDWSASMTRKPRR